MTDSYTTNQVPIQPTTPAPLPASDGWSSAGHAAAQEYARQQAEAKSRGKGGKDGEDGNSLYARQQEARNREGRSRESLGDAIRRAAASKEARGTRTRLDTDKVRDRSSIGADNKRMNDILAKASAKVLEKLGDDEDAAAAMDDLRELSGRYGGETPAELLKKFLAVDKDFRGDPIAAGNRLADHYLRQSPRGEPSEKELKAQERREEREKEDKSINASIRRARKMLADKNATSTEGIKEIRAEMKKLFPGVPFSKLVRSVTEQDKNLSRDPLGTAARIATSYGAPLTESAQAEHLVREIDQQEHATRVGEISNFIDHIKPAMPDFDSLADGIADEIDLMNREGRRTNNPASDLFFAWLAARDKAMAGSRAAGSKSISGAPSQAAMAAADKPDPKRSIRDILARAQERAGARA